MSFLLAYTGAKGVADFWMLVVNGLLASAIFVRVLFAHLAGHVISDWRERLARFALVAAYGVLALRVWAGWYNTPVEPTHIAVNAIVLWLVWLARGDVSVIVTALRTLREKTSAGPPAV